MSSAAVVIDALRVKVPKNENINEFANSKDADEAAHYEPPHLELRGLQVQLFFFLFRGFK